METRNIYLIAVLGVLGAYVWHSGWLTKSLSSVQQPSEECLAEFYQVKNEVNMRLKYASTCGNWVAIQAYRPLAFEVMGIERRLNSPDCNLTAEQEKIKAIKSMLFSAPKRGKSGRAK